LGSIAACRRWVAARKGTTPTVHLSGATENDLISVGRVKIGDTDTRLPAEYHRTVEKLVRELADLKIKRHGGDSNWWETRGSWLGRKLQELIPRTGLSSSAETQRPKPSWSG